MNTTTKMNEVCSHCGTVRANTTGRWETEIRTNEDFRTNKSTSIETHLCSSCIQELKLMKERHSTELQLFFHHITTKQETLADDDVEDEA